MHVDHFDISLYITSTIDMYIACAPTPSDETSCKFMVQLFDVNNELRTILCVCGWSPEDYTCCLRSISARLTQTTQRNTHMHASEHSFE